MKGRDGSAREQEADLVDRDRGHPPYGEPHEPTEPEDLVAAVHHGDWPRALELAKDGWLQLLCNHPNTLRWLFRVVPDEVIAADPVAKAGRDLLGYVLGRADESTELPEDPEQLAAMGRADDVREVLLVALVDGILLRAGGRYRAARELAERLATLATTAEQERPDVVRDLVASCWMMIAVSRVMAGALGPAEVAYRRAYAGHLGNGDGPLARAAASGAALCLALDGDAHTAERWLDAEAALPEPSGWLAVRGPAPGKIARVHLALDRMDGDGAAEAVRALRHLDHREELWAQAAAATAEVALVFGHPLAGLRRLEADVERNGTRMGDGASHALIARASAELLLAGGLGNRARALLDASDPDDAGAQVVLAKLRLLTRDADGAAADATTVLWRSDLAPRVRMEALAVLSAAHLRADDSAALREFGELVDLVDHYGNLRPLLAMPRVDLVELAGRSGSRPRGFDERQLGELPEVYATPVVLVELTPRERQVLLALDEGLDPVEIAERWVVSIATVRSQIHSVYRKLGVHRRQDAITRGREWGITSS